MNFLNKKKEEKKDKQFKLDPENIVRGVSIIIMIIFILFIFNQNKDSFSVDSINLNKLVDYENLNK